MIFTRDASTLLSQPLIPPRMGGRRGRPFVTTQVAMQQSVNWAAMNLWAALESMMPVDVFRVIDGIKVPVAAPQVLVSPSSFADGHSDSISDWLYARRMSLKGWGNCFGEITAVDALGKPAQIQLVAPEDVRCTIVNRRIVEYKFGNTVMDSRRVWHDRENLLPGNPVGLSPIAHAMFTIQTGSSAGEFMADWFGNGAVPGAHLKNVAKVLKKATPTERAEADVIKEKFKNSMLNGDLFVTGNDWTYTAIQAKAAESGWLDVMNVSAIQLCQFQNTPASLIDVSVTGSASIVYQNITQRITDFLVTRMGPSLKRTDDALTSLTPSPRFVKLTREAVLAMDPVTRAELLKTKIDSRTLTPTEARHIDDRAPFTEEQLQEFDRLYGSKNQTPAPKGIPA
ncbi:MAG TPA: phage portal protein [Propionicimonas sp.]|jgi:HK97 family phage portal protein